MRTPLVQQGCYGATAAALAPTRHGPSRVTVLPLTRPLPPPAAQPAPAVPNTVAKKKLWEAAQPGLRTSAERVAGFGALTMMTSAGPVRVAGEALAGARIA